LANELVLKTHENYVQGKHIKLIYTNTGTENIK